MRLASGFLTIRQSKSFRSVSTCTFFQKLDKKYTYKTLNIFQVIIDMLEERKLFDRICQREPELGLETLKKHLAAPLSQKKSRNILPVRSIFPPSNLSF
jgi:hypothetical protein